MVQIQSSWFPLYDRNPQTFVPNIFWAKPADYRKATQRIYHSLDHASFIEMPLSPLLRPMAIDDVSTCTQNLKCLVSRPEAPCRTSRAQDKSLMQAPLRRAPVFIVCLSHFFSRLFFFTRRRRNRRRHPQPRKKTRRISTPPKLIG